MKKITKDTLIGDILDICPDAAPLFLEMGMHCLGCPASRGESVEQACAVHGNDPEKLVEKLFDGAPEKLFAALLGGKKLSSEQADRLRELVAEAEGGR